MGVPVVRFQIRTVWSRPLVTAIGRPSSWVQATAVTGAVWPVSRPMGVPVVKTGYRGYTSQTGSFDLLDYLGIPLTTSYQQTGELLDRYNIACAGYFVYPAELAAQRGAV